MNIWKPDSAESDTGDRWCNLNRNDGIFTQGLRFITWAALGARWDARCASCFRSPEPYGSVLASGARLMWNIPAERAFGAVSDEIREPHIWLLILLIQGPAKAFPINMFPLPVWFSHVACSALSGKQIVTIPIKYFYKETLKQQPELSEKPSVDAACWNCFFSHFTQINSRMSDLWLIYLKI